MNNQAKPIERKRPVDLQFGKVAPQAADLESAILGALMLFPEVIDEVMGIIPSSSCFYSDANQKIFAAIQAMYRSGSGIDFMTVCDHLRKKSELESVGGSYYVSGLTRDVVSSANIDEHARIVMQKYLKREMIKHCGELLTEAYDEGVDIFDLMADAEQRISRLTEDNIQTPYRTIAHNAAQDMEDIAEHMERIRSTGQTLTGISAVFQTLNRITNGWQSGDLIILAARPSVGKTAFALNLAIGAGVPVGFFSLEMNLESLRKRINSMQTGIGLTNITSCRLDDAQFSRIRQNMGKLSNLPLYVDDSFVLTVYDIKAKARRMIKREGVKMIIIDYLQLITPTSERMIREQQVSQISRELKKLAKELQIPVIALSQMSRDIEKRKEGKEPVLSDLRESGAIEQDADIVTFLYWHDENIRLRFAKHRNGKLDYIDFQANLDIQKFSELGNEFPELKVEGFKATEHSGQRLIPMAEAVKKFHNDDEEDLPF